MIHTLTGTYEARLAFVPRSRIQNTFADARDLLSRLLDQLVPHLARSDRVVQVDPEL